MSGVLTDAEVAAIARPGETWTSARQRAERLRRSVRLCRPCHECDQEIYSQLGIAPGWIDEGRFCCPSCSYEKDNESFFYLEELQREVVMDNASMLTWPASL